MSKDLKDRLLKNSIWNGDCLESTYKARSQSGYALIKYKRSTIGAHRISWMVHNGHIPENICVLHKCDNPLCINPDHLFLGTYQDNTNDMIEKNRNNFTGAKVHNDEVVKKAIEMRSKGMTHKHIAEILGISMSSLNSFFRRTSCKELVKDFYANPKYSQEIINKAYELRKAGVKCKDIQNILSIPKRSLTRIFNTPYKRFDINYPKI